MKKSNLYIQSYLSFRLLLILVNTDYSLNLKALFEERTLGLFLTEVELLLFPILDSSSIQSSILIWFMCKSVTLCEDTLFDGHVILWTFAFLLQIFVDLRLRINEIMTMIIATNVLLSNRYINTDSTALVHRDSLL